MKILLVDHNRSFGDVLKVGLKAVGGHSVDSCETAAEALEAVRREPYSLALVEYTADGREFLTRYRQVDPLLAVVVLTSLPTQESAVEFLRGGSDALALDYIVKPEPDLIRKLSEIIEARFSRVMVGEWTADRRLAQAYFKGEPVTLTLTEFAIFLYFLLHPYEPVQHEELWLAARGEYISHRQAVTKMRAHVSALRTKLDQVAGYSVIQGRHKGGFRFMPDVAARSRRQSNKNKTLPEIA